MLKRCLLSILGACLLSLVSYSEAYASAGCLGDCTACHQITKEEVASIVSKLNGGKQNIKIAYIDNSPIQGLWSVHFMNNGEEGVFYIDYSKRNVLAGLIIPLSDTLKAAEVQSSNKRVSISQARSLSTALVAGNPAAAKKIIVFEDPDCHFCERLSGEIKTILAKRRDLAFYIEILPVLKKRDYLADKRAYCARAKTIFEHAYQGVQATEVRCEPDQVDNIISVAKANNINVVPVLVFPDNRVVKGYLSAKEILANAK